LGNNAMARAVVPKANDPKMSGPVEKKAQTDG